ncbi:hypothetical protein KFE25_001353 [Diacronema lutheri]|uniref:Ubiquitin carboxyl-terminal hydrolase n=1 Tax=Diacronema lutheri TaxID=2081491 RepID=A0A8J6C9M0_DIALT|nr:hypothetical protein KFE25_001353 [Diacronema lutheri]
MAAQHWLPLESNPEVLNGFAAKLRASPSHAFHDVFGLEAELLAMVPQPAIAVLLLFPPDQMREAKAEQLERLRAEAYAPEPGLFFMRQYVGNACGTIAAVHALLNNKNLVTAGSELGAFLEANAQLTPEERGANLARAEFVSAATAESAQGGQTAAPRVGEDVEHHFVVFVQHGGNVYELDGTKPFPIKHGPVLGGDLLATAAEVIKREFFAHAPDGQFNVMALAPA